MRTAFLFPGQGSVHPGMGKDLLSDWPAARDVYERASRQTGKDIAAICSTHSRRQLAETATAHMAVFVYSLAALAVLKDNGIEPAFVSGHSLGQFAAVTAAGSLTMEEGLCLIEKRGALLAESCARRPGSMIAVRGCPHQDVEALIGAAGEGVLCVAGFNGRDEIVLSGDSERIRWVMPKIRERGGTVFPLNVSGAFHSRIVADAASAFEMEVGRSEFSKPRWPVVSTRSGLMLDSAEEIKAEVAGHMLQPVRWDLVLDTLFGRAVDRWIEVGPGRVLTVFVLRRDRRARCFHTDSSAAVRKLLGDAGSMERAG